MLINGKKTTIHKGLSFSFDDDGITYSGNKNKTTVTKNTQKTNLLYHRSAMHAEAHQGREMLQLPQK